MEIINNKVGKMLKFSWKSCSDLIRTAKLATKHNKAIPLKGSDSNLCPYQATGEANRIMVRKAIASIPAKAVCCLDVLGIMFLVFDKNRCFAPYSTYPANPELL